MKVSVAACAPVTPPETGASTRIGLRLSHPGPWTACHNYEARCERMVELWLVSVY